MARTRAPVHLDRSLSSSRILRADGGGSREEARANAQAVRARVRASRENCERNGREATGRAYGGNIARHHANDTSSGARVDSAQTNLLAREPNSLKRLSPCRTTGRDRISWRWRSVSSACQGCRRSEGCLSRPVPARLRSTRGRPLQRSGDRRDVCERAVMRRGRAPLPTGSPRAFARRVLA